MNRTPQVLQSGIQMQPDVTRVIARLFVPGREDVGPGDSRAAPVIERILALGDDEIESALTDVEARFAQRHPDLHEIFETNAAMVTSRIDPDVELSRARLLVLGAAFTHEYAIEAAALCNPSAVLHPHQVDEGGATFVLSVRGIGEGHRSSIGFRTGHIGVNGAVTVEPAAPFPHTGTTTAGRNRRSVLHAKLGALDDDRENAAYVLDSLPELFDDSELNARIDGLASEATTRRNTATTIASLRGFARSSYDVTFDPAQDLSERVLWPHAPAESNGMEDARFVRFTDDSGAITYYGTYTAFNGTEISQHLLETDDFVTFSASPMGGPAAIGKGLALFPRKVGGRFAALSRSDRETNAIAFSDDVRCWPDSQPIQTPTRAWELLQLGNCGSPIETEAGWLVLTHGVGPMRTYSLGAILLDLDDPGIVLAHSVDPILSPGNDRRDGYVPNVIYSCGGFAHHDTLVLPYAMADQHISIATLSISELVASMRRAPVLVR